jgi:uncharacterized protein (TIGR02271 family)
MPDETMTTSTGANDTPRTMVAVFRDRESAREALSELHNDGYRDTWLGITQGAATTASAGGSTSVTVQSEEGGGLKEALGRFFSGGESEQSLHQALINRGVSEAQAQRIDQTALPGSAIVTVDPENDLAGVVTILRRYGGEVSTGLTGESTAASIPGTSSAAAAATTTAGAATDAVDEARRIQLREERLTINKRQVQRGEARIRKDVVAEQQSVDVPISREELFIERRPVSAEAAAGAAPIGEEGEEIRVTLTEERAAVEKRPVVTEEVAIGKRRVEETQHVTETVRREELQVDDPTAKASATRRRRARAGRSARDAGGIPLARLEPARRTARGRMVCLAACGETLTDDGRRDHAARQRDGAAPHH